MVTVEQKISLFSKLLNRTMNFKFIEEYENQKRDYELKIKKIKEEAGKEADKKKEESKSKAEAERIELLSRVGLESRREYISVKQKCFNIFMKHFRDRVMEFIQSEKYGEYFYSLLNKLRNIEFSNKAVFYMNNRDYDRFKPIIGKVLSESFSFDTTWTDLFEMDKLKTDRLKTELLFFEADHEIMGGFIIEDCERKIRYDFTIEKYIEDNKLHIMQVLFEAIETDEQ